MRCSVAYQGEPGAFSYVAAESIFGRTAASLPCSRFEQVFEAVRDGRALFGLLPVENTLHGSVVENFDLLLAYRIPIRGEFTLRIAHQLIALPGVALNAVRQVYSHPVALNQCLNFFRLHPQLEPVAHYDTAGSVKMLSAAGRTDAAAIASLAAAELYRANVLLSDIEDDRANFTRFVLIGPQPLPPALADGNWKTSVAFALPNVPGSLARAVECFAARQVNLLKIESRPWRSRPWEYLFYLDLAGHQEDGPVQAALRDLEACSDLLHVLGTYRAVARRDEPAV